MSKPATARRLLTAAAMAATLTMLTAASASAAHCTDSGRPGNSDFATHVDNTRGPGGHNEGDHRGRSSCEENSANYTP
jgi:Spy/CpxP family protein refolding chaperone